MSTLTAALYGLLATYLGGWFLGHWTGNFSLLLFMLTVVTLAYWLAERFHFAPARAAAAAALEQQDAARRAQLASQGITRVDGDLAQARQKLLMQPWWLDWTAGLFPVILVARLDCGPVPGVPDRLPVALVPVRAVQNPVGLVGAHADGR